MQAVSTTLPKPNTKIAAAVRIYGRHYERCRKGALSAEALRQEVIESILEEMNVDKASAANLYHQVRVRLGLQKVDHKKGMAPFPTLLNNKVSGTVVREETKKKVLTNLSPVATPKQAVGNDPYSVLKASVLAAFAQYEKATKGKVRTK